MPVVRDADAVSVQEIHGAIDTMERKKSIGNVKIE